MKIIIAFLLMASIILVPNAQADVLSINSGGDENIVITPNEYIDGFFFSTTPLFPPGGRAGGSIDIMDPINFTLNPEGFFEDVPVPNTIYYREVTITNISRDGTLIAEFNCIDFDPSCEWATFIEDGVAIEDNILVFNVDDTVIAVIPFLVQIPNDITIKEYKFNLTVADYSIRSNAKNVEYVLASPLQIELFRNITVQHVVIITLVMLVLWGILLINRKKKKAKEIEWELDFRGANEK